MRLPGRAKLVPVKDVGGPGPQVVNGEGRLGVSEEEEGLSYPLSASWLSSSYPGTMCPQESECVPDCFRHKG